MLQPTASSAWNPFSAKRFPPVLIGPIARAVVVLAALVSPGCSISPPPEFNLNLEGRDPDEITLAQLGLANVTAKEIDQAIGTLYPDGADGVDDGEVVRAVFLNVKESRRQDTGDRVSR